MNLTSLPPTLDRFAKTPVVQTSSSQSCEEDTDECGIGEADLLQLQATLARQLNSFEAMKALAAWFSDRLPEANVRVGWGAGEPNGLYDHRLGKLGPESSLWSQLLERWPRVNAAEDEPLPQKESVWICFPSGDASPHVALLWIDSTSHANFLLDRLQPAREAVGAVLWSRPRTKFTWRWAFGHRVLSWRIAGVVAVLLLLALLPVSYRVTCRAVMQPLEQRIVVAPFEATLLECYVEPGDAVRKNDLLLLLDGRPLLLELEALKADLSQAMKQQSSAMATGRIAESQLAELESRQLQKRIELFQSRLDRLEVRSPIDGLVVSGDLARSVGAPLEMGKPLLEIAPLERMIVEVEIPEEDIHYVSIGDSVRVRLDASVQQAIEGRLRQVFPQTELREERNVFVGRWEMANEDDSLRPGMQGKAVVYGPKRALAWPWVRRAHEAVLRAVGW